MCTDKDRVGIITFYHHKIMTETIKLIKQDKKKKPKATINAFNDNGDDLTLQVSLLSSYFYSFRCFIHISSDIYFSNDKMAYSQSFSCLHGAVG